MRDALLIFASLSFCAVAIFFNKLWTYTPLPEYIGTYVHALREAQEYAAFSAGLLASPIALELPVPVYATPARDVADTWGAARSAGRTHEGTDIFAERGSLVLSATPGIVLRMGTSTLGGKHVFVAGPGGERYYYAHLDDFSAYISEGMRVGTTTILGYVGTTGNASGTPPHLHFGIYGNGGARNPYERLR